MVKSLVGDVTFAEERILKETEEKKGRGWNFGRSVAGKKMRKEGLGVVGLLQDVVSGRQEYRKTERRQRDGNTSF